MGFKDREIEIKLHTGSLSFLETKDILESFFNRNSDLDDFSQDTYWKIPNQERAFSRLRNLGNEKFQLTIKKEDKLDTRDRIEIDLDLEPTYKYSILAYQDIAFGPSVGKITKRYAVWFMDDLNKYKTVSCYAIQVNGKDIDGTFIEVEGPSMEYVETLTDSIMTRITDLKHCSGSLYNMFINPRRNSVYDWGQL